MKRIINYKYYLTLVVLILFFHFLSIIRFPVSSWFFTISIFFLTASLFVPKIFKSLITIPSLFKRKLDAIIKEDKNLISTYSIISFIIAVILLIFSYDLLAVTAKLHLLIVLRVFLGLVTTATISLVIYINSKKIFTIFANEQLEPSKKSTIIVLLILIAIGLFLRTWNLENLTPYTDEYPHLIAARDIALGYEPYYEVYNRSLWLVTMPVAAVFKIFGPSLALARMVGAVISLLAILPIFLITKRVNKLFALIAVALYVFDPLLVGLARNVREYAFYPPIFYLATLAGIIIIEKIKEAHNWLDLRNILLKKQVTLSVLYLLGILFYSISVDGLSTLKIIAGLYLAIAILAVINLYKNFANKMPFFLAVLFVLITGLFLAQSYPHLTKFIFLSPNADWDGLKLIFIDLFGMQNPWQTILILTVWICSFLYFIFKPKLALQLIFFCILLYLYFLTFHFDRNLNLRHAGFLNYWYILFYGLGLSGLMLLIKSLVKNYSIVLVLLSASILTAIQPWKTLEFVTNRYHQIVPITNLYHDDLKEAASFLDNKANGGQILIGTNLTTYMNFYHPSSFAKYVPMFKFDEIDLEKLKIEMDEYKSGWIAIDERRRTWAGLADDADLDYRITGFRFEKSKINDQFLYYFEKNSAESNASEQTQYLIKPDEE